MLSSVMCIEIALRLHCKRNFTMGKIFALPSFANDSNFFLQIIAICLSLTEWVKKVRKKGNFSQFIVLHKKMRISDVYLYRTITRKCSDQIVTQYLFVYLQGVREEYVWICIHLYYKACILFVRTPCIEISFHF